ncbi:YwqJ-related putative deaminase [Amycolatopsis sp. NPDC021455]|uniref:YwqJ-related putative deaminase n=1 Tax=Amycolatopsis sp. NPDC021455 TaxID=3154901 RepID=UPI0034108390
MPHSFLAGTKVLLADGSSKPISSVRVGDRVANSQPGKPGLEAHPVDRVIVTATDHDFVELKVKPGRVRQAVGRAVAGLAVAAAVVTGGATTASAVPATLTTTYHHPFYDVTRGAFVEAVDLQVGDRLQTADGGEATVEEVTPYRASSIRPGSARPAVAEAIRPPGGGRGFSSTSQRGGEPPQLHEDVQAILDSIPENERGVGHGRCGLAVCLSEALNNDLDPTGWDAAAVKVRGSTAHPAHGEGVGPCPSCVPLVEEYDLTFLTGEGK